jgi:hypothetical protein
MSTTTYGYGDEATWPACTGHPNDPRTEVDEDDDAPEAREENDFDRRMREREERNDWLDDCAADRAAEEYFARRDRA